MTPSPASAPPLADASILITGGTGSFGQRLLFTLLGQHRPRRVVIFSRDELKQYELQQKLLDHPQADRVRFFLGDVRDRDRLVRAFDGVDYVVHAAALKQEPAAEYNPLEFIKTNILGAANIIEAAIDRNVKRVVALSTDKAANPVNLYGATKLCSDKLFVSAQVYSGAHATRFCVVRYGNVMGSRGSVIPLFLRQRETGRLTITDERMTRFWISLQQGVDFVLDNLLGMAGFAEPIVPSQAANGGWSFAVPCSQKLLHRQPRMRDDGSQGANPHTLMSRHDDTTRRFGSDGDHVAALLPLEGHAQPLENLADIFTGQVARQLRSIGHGYAASTSTISSPTSVGTLSPASRQSRHVCHASAVFLPLANHGESHWLLPPESFVRSPVIPPRASAARWAPEVGGRFLRSGRSLPRQVPSTPRRASRDRRHGCR